MLNNKIKFVVNGRFLSQASSGVQNYASGIIKALLKTGIEIEVLCPPTKINNQEIPVKQIGFFGGIIWEQIILPSYIRKRKNVILLNLCNSAPLFIKQQIITIHDLAFEENSDWYNPMFKRWYKFMIPRLCKNARFIITVSEFSKSKIIEKYDILESKIIVSTPGIPKFIFNDIADNFGDYMLLTGVNNPRKNAEWIINNSVIFKKRGLKIVALNTNSKVYNNISLSGDESVIHINNASFTNYCTLLKNAKALIYPSLYEGFGIPILESLCMGIPVIASNLPVFKEAFGDLPEYFELGHISSLIRALDNLKENKISENDINYLKNKFNFENSARQILKTVNIIM